VGGIRCEWFVPNGWNDGPTFLHVHGGGYALCSSITHRTMISDIARAAGARGLGVDYRLAPEHPFPAGIDDCESAYHGLLQQGVPPGKLVLSGDSAGGAIVLATLLRLREQALPLPRAAVLLSPWADLSFVRGGSTRQAPFDYIQLDFMRFFAGIYLAGEDPANPFASPINADLTGLPPLLIQAGSAEILLPDIARLARRAEEYGVDVTLQVYEGMVHAFQGFTLFLPEARLAMTAIGRFIREKTGAPEITRSRSLPPPEPAARGGE
jgi:acetyl esterase/lipase